MQIARVRGHATATVKHPSLEGTKLLACQLLGANGQATGDPVLAVDKLGAGCGDCGVRDSDLCSL